MHKARRRATEFYRQDSVQNAPFRCISLNSKILPVKFALLKLENNAATTNTHLVTLHLTELAQSAMKPRLRLDRVGTMAMSELPTQYSDHMKHGLRSYPTGVFVIPYIWEVLVTGGCSRGPSMAAFEANPLLDARMPKTKAMLELEGDSWMKTINEIAEGNRRDLFRAIKEKIKRNRAQS